MVTSTVEIIFEARNVVGESLVWDDRAGRLVWVDIIGRTIHCLDAWKLDHTRWNMPDLVTSVGLREDGGAVIGLCKEVALWDFRGPLQTLASIEADQRGTRLNEGVVAPDGSFWVGTMANNIGPDDAPVDITEDAGRIYQVDANGGVIALNDDRFRHHQHDGVDGRWTFRHRGHDEKRALQLSMGSLTVAPRRQAPILPKVRAWAARWVLHGRGGLHLELSSGRRQLPCPHRAGRFARSCGGASMLVADELCLRRQGSRYALRNVSAFYNERTTSRRQSC